MKRTAAIWILLILAVLAGLVAAWQALQYAGLLPFSLGPLKFYASNWFAAIMEAILAAIWFWVAKMIYDLNPSGWLFVVVIAVVNLIFAFVAWLAGSNFNALLLYAGLNLLALILGLLPSTKSNFGQK
jgi:hypothetical protein